MIREGSKVAFIWDDHEKGLSLNDQGKIVQSGHTASHVIMTSGRQQGQIILLRNEDLIVTAASNHSDLDDSISESGFVRTAIRDTFDRYGSLALVNELSSEGALDLDGIAEQALIFITSKVRNDPGAIQVMAELDADEADEFIGTAVATLLREAFEVA